MRFHLPAFVLLAALACGPAAAATRNFTVTSFDRIRLDGPYRVKLTTNVAPFARASGAAAAIDGVSVQVQGRTLVIRRNPSAWGSEPGKPSSAVDIEIGTHELSAAWVNGSGSVAVDRVKGGSFELSINGAGSASVGNLNVDHLKVGISGTGTAIVGGTAKEASALVRGMSSLDASGLSAKNATIAAEGAGVVKLNVSGTAKVDAHGPTSVQLGGKPACTTRTEGAAEVTGCR